MKKRCDLHNHTYKSNERLRDALQSPEELIDKAISIGLQGVAITDHETLSAHPKAYKYWKEKQKEYPYFKVILGNEIYLVDERPSDNHYHYILLAKDKIGHRQLRRLSSIAWLNHYETGRMRRVDTLKSDLWAIVKSEPGHLIASTACIGGELGKSILAGNIQKAEEFIKWNKELFQDDFYLEIQPGISDEQRLVNQKIADLSIKTNTKVIITSDTHYLRPEDRAVHRSFLNSENKEREVDAFYRDAYLHTEQEIYEKLIKSNISKDFINQAFRWSMEIYNKIGDCELAHNSVIPKVDIEFTPKNRFAINAFKYSTLSSMFYSDDNVERYWVNKCINRLHEINKYNETYLKELEEEAQVKRIVGKRLNTNMFYYPITLAHYINMIWEQDSTVGVGRGSACSALNHYLLGITQLDPIEWNFPFFRYMNKDTDGLGDIDIDVCSSKVQSIVLNIRKERSRKFTVDLTDIERQSLGANYVCTFGTESSKSAVKTACRGYRTEDYPNGIDIDTAEFLSSLIPSERGFTWSIEDVYYGNAEKDRRRSPAFKKEIDKYPGLLDIMINIGGITNRIGRHASGVLFLGEDPYEFNAFMVTPSGEIVTQYDLHDAEYCGSVKMDILVTEVQDKIVETIHLLQKYNEIPQELSLREAYNKYLHPDVLPLKDDYKTWNTIQNAATLDLFQLDSDIGRVGTKKVKPTNMIELSSVNGLIRLMTAEKGQETWLDKYVRYENINEYYKDISKYQLTEKELRAINRHVGHTRGIGISQEQLMTTLMDNDICNYSLKEANKARKIVSKKKMKEIPGFRKKVYETAKSKGLADYVWDYIVAPQLGYGFSDIHSISYSFIGFQTAYLPTHWNPIYWNTACLIINSGSLEQNQISEEKSKSSNYDKMAKAMGSISSKGIRISLVDINKSGYTFKPDLEHNQIMFGLKGLSGINDDTIKKIKAGRPYNGIADFMQRCSLDKTSMLSLIKAGAFDNTDKSWTQNYPCTRYGVMAYYVSKMCGVKTKITLQNFNGLANKGLIPEKLDFEKNVFYFNKGLKANQKVGQYYVLDGQYYTFYEYYFDLDETEIINNLVCIPTKKWDKIYKKVMDTARDYFKEHQEELLRDFNRILFSEYWNDNASGTVSDWEMDSMNCYYNKHPLCDIDKKLYGVSNFYNLPVEPVPASYFRRSGRDIPLYQLTSIVGTVVSKNDSRSSISLLTPDGVVAVKMNREYYAMFSKRISGPDPETGKRKILEKGWFTRGTKLFCTGYRRDDTFVLKTYKNTGRHQLYKIEECNGEGRLILRHERYGMAED